MTANLQFPLKERHYSLTWALTIVEALCEKYARATEILKAVFELRDTDLAVYVAYSDRFWPYFRDQVHSLDKLMNEIHSYDPNILSMRRGYLDRIHTVSSQDLRLRITSRLTSLGSYTTLKEQSRKGPTDAKCTHLAEAGFLTSLNSSEVQKVSLTQLELQFE